MQFQLVADSSANVLSMEDVSYASVPMKIRTREKEYVDDAHLDVEQMVLEMEQLQQKETSWEDDPLCGMTQEEYNEMYERIRAELMEELKYFVEIQAEQQAGSETAQTE